MSVADHLARIQGRTTEPLKRVAVDEATADDHVAAMRGELVLDASPPPDPPADPDSDREDDA